MSGHPRKSEGEKQKQSSCREGAGRKGFRLCLLLRGRKEQLVFMLQVEEEEEDDEEDEDEDEEEEEEDIGISKGKAWLKGKGTPDTSTHHPSPVAL